MFWPYFCWEGRLSWILHLHGNKRSLNICTAVSRTHSGSVRYSIRGLNQKPSLSSLSLFLGLVPRSSSEWPACVSEGSTHDSECVQPATAEGAVHDVFSHLACYQNTFFRFHTSSRAVSAVLFSWILGCAFKPVKSKKSFLIWYIQALNGKTPHTHGSFSLEIIPAHNSLETVPLLSQGTLSCWRHIII